MPSHSVGGSFDSTTFAVSKRDQGKAIWDEPHERALAIGSNRLSLASSGDYITEHQQ